MNNIAHVFWGHPTVKEADTPVLPENCVVGLQSAVRHFSTVCLWQYEDVANAPNGVVKCDAKTLLPSEERRVLMQDKNIPILHISDIVRFRAAATHGGWVVDCDCVWLRAPPSSGFVFSTAWAKRTGGMAPRGATAAKQQALFRKEGWDGSGVINTPFRVVRGETSFLLDAVETTVQKIHRRKAWKVPATTQQYNTFMHMIRDVVVSHDLGSFVRPPIEYNVCPFWRGMTSYIVTEFFDRPPEQRVKYGVQLPSTQEILDTAYCIPTSFYFSCHSRTYTAHSTTMRDVPASSLLGRVMALAPQTPDTTTTTQNTQNTTPSNGDPCPLPIFWINRDCDTERAAYMRAQFETHRFPTTHRVSAAQPEDVRNLLAGRPVRKAAIKNSLLEISCTMSHLRAMRAAFDTGCAAAIVCEDDADFTPFSTEKLTQTIRSLPDDWDILQLYTLTLSALPIINRLAECTAVSHVSLRNRRRRTFNGTQAYVISRAGMEKLLKQWNDQPLVSRQGAPVSLNAEVFIYGRCQSFLSSRPFVRHNLDTESTIHPTHADHHKKAEERVTQFFTVQ